MNRVVRSAGLCESEGGKQTDYEGYRGDLKRIPGFHLDYAETVSDAILE